MSSYSSRNNRYYDSMRQSHGNNSRSQSGNPVDDESMEEMSEDLQKIFDDDSKCARLLKKVLRDERSFDLRIQRIQEFQVYLEKSDSSKFIMKLAEPALNVLFEQFQERSHETIRSELVHCIGLIGYVMLNEGEPKFAQWIFDRLNAVRKNDIQKQLLVSAFRHSIQNEHEILSTNQIADLQKIFLQINGIWQNDNTAEHIKTSLDILQMRKHTNEMQLIAYRWKNFYLLNSNNKNQQRQTICEELTTDQSILTINDSISTMIIDKMTSLEQTVIQRLRWAAGANPLVQDVLDKFEMRQKERANEIDNDKQLCLHLVKILQSWLLFEQYEEQIKLQRDLIIHARTFAEKGLEICQLKHDIESNFTIVEQAILEFPPVENLKQITLQNLPSLIEQAENECMKHKRNRIKEERELENRRVFARGVRGAIIKIDIEGSESFVIESGSRVFDTLEIPFIQMEWFKVRDYPDRVKIIIDFFVKRNYDPKTLSCQLLNVNQHITWPNDLCWIKRNVSNFC
ncbi:unnamed protein product [Rotaria sp. Silwood2]|nr:unnamed protein product [Rotaria sp. Silwood2]